MKIILIYLFNSAKYKAGKYQMAQTPANTFCKFVKQFSFTVSTASLRAALPDIEHHLKIMTFNKIEKIFSTSASLRCH